jgi:ubiquinone/menaquinone biosynthesis C-methylase UbiE
VNERIDPLEAAIEVHSSQAGEFARRYDRRLLDPYADCFAYSRHRLDALLHRLVPASGEGRSLIDVGCGTGNYVKEFIQHGFTVSGVDASEEMLAYARKSNPAAELRLGRVEALPFSNAAFDFAVCIEVLRYLPDPASCLAELARVLKPSGVAIVTAAPLFSVNFYPLVNRIARTFHASNLVNLRQYFSTSSGLRRKFRGAGFERITAYGVSFGPVNWVERLLPSLTRPFLRRWEPLDARLAGERWWADLANMLLIYAVKRSR